MNNALNLQLRILILIVKIFLKVKNALFNQNLKIALIYLLIALMLHYHNVILMQMEINAIIIIN